MATERREIKQPKALPAPNVDFYELSETLPAEEREVVKQVRDANDIVVPLEGAGAKLTSTISSPIQVHGVTKVSAKRAPELGEHNEEILQELGFDTKQIDSFLASGTVTEHRELALK